MTEQFEYKGYWYLPSTPNNKVAGILTFIPNESINLELLGMLEESKVNIIDIFERDDIDIIWGITSDGYKISLINCLSSSSRFNFSSNFPITRYSIQYCIEGIHIKDFLEKRFSWCNINMPELTNWCHPGALKLQYTFSDNDRKEIITVSAEEQKVDESVVSVNLDGKTTLEIKKEVSFDGSFHLLNQPLSNVFFYK